MSEQTIEILFQDNDLIAVNKPSGLLVHRSMIDRHETRFAIQLVRDMIGQYVYPVHRLDKPTSGVLLFALKPQIANELMLQFSAHTIEKRYLAIVRGYCDKQGEIDYPLKEKLDKIADSMSQTDKPAQQAVTSYECLDTVELPYAIGPHASSRYSLLRVSPKTGRRHQIRRHMKHIFHPIVGDTTHGDGRHNQLFRNTFNSHRLLLSATELTLTHPVTKQPITIHAPLDDEFTRLMQLFQWQQHNG